MQSTTRCLDFRVDDRVAWITLNRPERLNALNQALFEELHAVTTELAGRDDVGVAVITGAGRAFCSGVDFFSFMDEVDIDDPNAVRRYIQWVGLLVSNWVKLEIPTIAAVNGVAVGGGANLALMCDLVVMREDAVIAENYVRRGFMLDMGASWLLSRRVGLTRAMELALLGEKITAAEAERIGLVNRCVGVDEFDAVVAEMAGRLVNGPATAIGMIKTALRLAPLLELDAALELEAHGMSMAFATEDVREAFAAFRERRDAVFQGR
jgi:2-(1,2-epoxy-1,2-dihydrophenyl)acetyl-CoA isomerase